MNKLIEILKRPAVILGTFILFKGIQTVYAYFSGERIGSLPALHLLSFVVMAVVSYFAIKRNKTAQWIMALYLLAQIITVLWAVIVIPPRQLSLKITAIVLSIYFVFGGWSLLKIARNKSGA
jgi:uncharacterized membrane protein HdeD (DUF308 family)